MMSRLTKIALWVVVIVVASFGLYRVKYEVQNVRAQIASVTQELHREKEALHVVAAEWAYLNRPDRLQALSRKYLGSSEVTVQQVADLQIIPFPKAIMVSDEDQGNELVDDAATQPSLQRVAYKLEQDAP
jgi:hypothetical protein